MSLVNIDWMRPPIERKLTKLVGNKLITAFILLVTFTSHRYLYFYLPILFGYEMIFNGNVSYSYLELFQCSEVSECSMLRYAQYASSASITALMATWDGNEKKASTSRSCVGTWNRHSPLTIQIIVKIDHSSRAEKIYREHV